MNLEIQVDDRQARGFLRAVYSDQLPWATSRAINLTALDAQRAQRAHQETIFTIRRKQFVQGAVKIKPFASKTSLQAIVKIDPPGGQARADILTKFESDTAKTPFRGSKIAVPTEHVPRTGAGIIQKRWRPGNLELINRSKSRVFSNRGRVLVGKGGIVAFNPPGGRVGAIFRRVDGDLVPYYWLVPRVRIRPNLRFIANAERTVHSRWEANFEAAFGQAMRTARGANLGAPLRSLAGVLGGL